LRPSFPRPSSMQDWNPSLVIFRYSAPPGRFPLVADIFNRMQAPGASKHLRSRLSRHAFPLVSFFPPVPLRPLSPNGPYQLFDFGEVRRGLFFGCRPSEDGMVPPPPAVCLPGIKVGSPSLAPGLLAAFGNPLLDIATVSLVEFSLIFFLSST